MRQLVGDGLVETIVTADDVTTPTWTDPTAYELALWELGVARGRRWPSWAPARA